MDTPGTVTSQYISKLSKIYSQTEAMAISHRVINHVLGLSPIECSLHKDKRLHEAEIVQFNHILEQLVNFKPVQYIFNKADFYDLEFYVDENVLIPRQETEELVYLIIRENMHKCLSILDIGTGSGCIAIALAANLAGSNLFALDRSPGAIDVAKRNAHDNHVSIRFFEADIFKPEEIKHIQKVDIIVSNPPYIRNSEMNQMHRNVIDFEPHIALFVENDDPLIFYRQILRLGKQFLINPGKIYFEINEALGAQMVELFEQFDYDNIRVIKDINGKDRIVTGELNLSS